MSSVGAVIIYSYLFFVFFFFKQKMAYEMRISDWSSDVCSSDLFARVRRYSAKNGPVDDHLAQVLDTAQTQLAQQAPKFFDGHEGEIGRASCRERVCQ